MTWFRLDDGLMQHPKVRAIPRRDRMRIMGQWMACGLWCAGQLTDGVLPGSVVDDEGGRDTDSAVLVKVGLWHEHGHNCPRCPQPEPGGYTFHDYLDFNRSRADVLAERESNAARQSRLRKRRRNGDGNGVTGDVTNSGTDPVSHGGSPGTPSRPVPSRPSSGSVTSSSHQGDARENDDDGGPTDDQLTVWAEGYAPAGVSTLIEAAAFRRENAHRWHDIRNPRAAWRGWLLKASERNRPTPVPDTPECPVHPGQPTGSKACPRCDVENIPAPADLRSLRGTA